jgi:hypothetical protein
MKRKDKKTILSLQKGFWKILPFDVYAKYIIFLKYYIM